MGGGERYGGDNGMKVSVGKGVVVVEKVAIEAVMMMLVISMVLVVLMVSLVVVMVLAFVRMVEMAIAVLCIWL